MALTILCIDDKAGPPGGITAQQALQRLERVTAGDEEAKEEYEKRNGYRIWKYYKKEKR